MKHTKDQKEKALASLKRLIRPGDTIHLMLKSVSRSGMSRWICPIIFKNGSRWYVGYNAAVLLDLRCNDQDVRMDGCGMDMGFALVYDLAHQLFDEKDVKRFARTKRAERFHLGSGKEPGYLLKHVWL